MRVENTKFKTRRTVVLAVKLLGESEGHVDIVQRGVPFATDNVELDADFKKAIEHAKNKPPTTETSTDTEKDYDTASLLPDMPSESDNASANSEGSDFLRKKPQHLLRINMRSQWYRMY